MQEVQIVHAPKPRPKLDPRLTTLVELGVEIVAPGELERFEAGLGEAGHSDLVRRTGPLAFFKGALRRHGQLEIALPQGAGLAGATRRSALPPTIPVFVRTKSAAALERLARSGIAWTSRAKTIATTDLALARLAELEGDDDVVAIEWTGAFRPQGSTSSGRGGCRAIGLDPTQIGDLDGRGGVVAIIDVEGIDLYHPSFVDSHGRTRLLAVWDQRSESGEIAFRGSMERGPGGLGVVYRREAIGLEISPHQLVRSSVVEHRAIKGSHGTMTAAMAAGLGEDRPDARGVAPGAQVLFVNTFGSGSGALGAMTELADAICFALNEAEKRRMPVVVNVSLGDDLGPHDGTSPIEQFIDEVLETPGRAIVVAAGNSHGNRRHAEASLDPGGTTTLEFVVAPRNTERAVIEIWYDPGDGPEGWLSLDIESPGSGSRSGWIVPNGVPRAFDVAGTRLLAISIPRYSGSEGTDRRNAVIRVEICALVEGDPLLSGTWRLHLQAHRRPVTAHAWVDHRYAYWQIHSDSLTLTTPATARRALVVGAYDEERDSSAWFSGRGEDRGGMRRPDLLAPGVMLVAAWAESTVRYIESASGTSFAAPLVAGACALLFQKLGADLSSDRLRGEISSLTRPTADDNRSLWIAPLREDNRAERRTKGDAGAPTKSVAMAATTGVVLPRITPKDAAQIHQGTYRIFRGQLLVGHVLVTPADRPRACEEHWAMSPEYRAPSPRHPEVSLRFEYAGPAVPLAHFARDLPRGMPVIRAFCEVSSTVRGRSHVAMKSTSSTVEAVDSISQGEQSMDTKNYMRPLDRTQVIQGRYHLYQGQTEVGSLLVTDDGPGQSTEHWLLGSSYLWPSASNTSQEIRFEYKGTVVPLSEFLQNVPAGTTYVIAKCEQQTLR